MKRKYLFIILSIMLIICVFCKTERSIYAKDDPVIEGMEAIDAIKDDVTICAVYDEFRDIPVIVELYPTFEGGGYHTYKLSKDDPITTDKIAVGNYHVIAYLDVDYDYSKSGHRAYSQTSELVISDSLDKSKSIAVVIIAGESYIEKYGEIITDYRTIDGEALKGVVPESEAFALKAEVENETKENAQSNNKMIEQHKQDSNENQEIVEEPQSEEIKEEEIVTEKNNINNYFKFIITTIIIVIILGIVIIIRKRKRGQIS